MHNKKRSVAWSVALVTVLGLVLLTQPAQASASAQVLYENGPINGEIYAWAINNGYSVSDTFTVSGGNSNVTGLSFGAWLYPGDTIKSVEVSITSGINGGTTYFDHLVVFSVSGCLSNQYGYEVCAETGNFPGPTLPEWNLLAKPAERDHSQR